MVGTEEGEGREEFSYNVYNEKSGSGNVSVLFTKLEGTIDVIPLRSAAVMDGEGERPESEGPSPALFLSCPQENN